VPMTLRQGLGAKVCRWAQSGHDPQKSQRSGRCPGANSNLDATPKGTSLAAGTLGGYNPAAIVRPIRFRRRRHGAQACRDPRGRHGGLQPPDGGRAGAWAGTEQA
jgi:hypothetical protein